MSEMRYQLLNLPKHTILLEEPPDTSLKLFRLADKDPSVYIDTIEYELRYSNRRIAVEAVGFQVLKLFQVLCSLKYRIIVERAYFWLTPSPDT